jgi:hypothetical protein
MNTFNAQNILKAAFGLTLALALVGNAPCALAPQFDKKVASESDQVEICAICREHLAPYLVTRTPCKHFFHTTCLCQALVVKKACPLCRTNFDIDQHQDFLTALQIPEQPAAQGDLDQQGHIPLNIHDPHIFVDMVDRPEPIAAIESIIIELPPAEHHAAPQQDGRDHVIIGGMGLPRRPPILMVDLNGIYHNVSLINDETVIADGRLQSLNDLRQWGWRPL